MSTETTLTRPLLQCPSDRQTWPSPQVTPGGQRININTCPHCGRKPEQVGRCGWPKKS